MVQHHSPFMCLTTTMGPIIYLLTREVPGGQITRYFGYHNCEACAAVMQSCVCWEDAGDDATACQWNGWHWSTFFFSPFRLSRTLDVVAAMRSA